MNKKIQKDVLNFFNSGKIIDASVNENCIKIIIDMSEFKQYYDTSYFRIELINCNEFVLNIKTESIKDIKKLKEYNAEIQGSGLKNNKLIVNCIINKNRATLIIDTESFKVYDKFNRELSLLKLLSLYELSSSSEGIDFFIKDDDSNKHIKFTEELHEYLCKSENYWRRYKENGLKEKFDLLIGLDQYGDKVFSTLEIKQLITICDGLLKKYDSENNKDEQKVRYFSKKFKRLCEEAIKRNKLIEAFGD
ncbi:hypothetical protein [Bacillus sp. AFS029533]|uniref:hypothetical protein n=1 Tax=Bacillus sp. AFS029533 TaxID=2033494 RepID=UPI000BFD117B|nr:hypothetical protein [Bacillus sp. AFS029533]PGZ91546.1 hypothetical protein COE53_14185 [Bacillus sp. AFS029533]